MVDSIEKELESLLHRHGINPVSIDDNIVGPPSTDENFSKEIEKQGFNSSSQSSGMPPPPYTPLELSNSQQIPHSMTLSLDRAPPFASTSGKGQSASGRNRGAVAHSIDIPVRHHFEDIVVLEKAVADAEHDLASDRSLLRGSSDAHEYDFAQIVNIEQAVSAAQEELRSSQTRSSQTMKNQNAAMPHPDSSSSVSNSNEPPTNYGVAAGETRSLSTLETRVSTNEGSQDPSQMGVLGDHLAPAGVGGKGLASLSTKQTDEAVMTVDSDSVAAWTIETTPTTFQHQSSQKDRHSLSSAAASLLQETTSEENPWTTLPKVSFSGSPQRRGSYDAVAYSQPLTASLDAVSLSASNLPLPVPQPQVPPSLRGRDVSEISLEPMNELPRRKHKTERGSVQSENNRKAQAKKSTAQRSNFERTGLMMPSKRREEEGSPSSFHSSNNASQQDFSHFEPTSMPFVTQASKGPRQNPIAQNTQLSPVSEDPTPIADHGGKEGFEARELSNFNKHNLDPEVAQLAEEMRVAHEMIVAQAVDRIAAMKMRLLTEHEEAIAASRSTTQKNIDKEQKAKECLRAKIEELAHDKEVLQNEIDASKMAIAENHHEKTLLFSRPYSMTNCLHFWSKHAAERRRKRHVWHLAVRYSTKGILRKPFASWRLEVQKSKLQRTSEHYEERIDKVTKEIIARYEAEFHRMMAEVNDAREQISLEQQRRKKLEDDFRRAILKGITTMNMEAISLFGQNVSADLVANVQENQSIKNLGSKKDNQR